MVVVAQLVRASDCDSEGRRFEPGHPPKKIQNHGLEFLFRFRFLCNGIIYLITILLSGFFGYGIIWFAIKMLFHPRKAVHVFGYIPGDFSKK